MVAVLLAALPSTGLSACGSSHSSKTPATAARAATPQSTTTTTTPTTPAPPATTSTPTTTTTTETPAQVAEREHTHALLVLVVNCVRRQGYHLPEPDAKNHINTRGVPLENSKYKSVATACLENPNKPAPGQESTKAP